MAAATRNQHYEQDDTPTEKKLDQLYSLIDGIDTAMMTAEPGRRAGQIGVGLLRDTRCRWGYKLKPKWSARRSGG